MLDLWMHKHRDEIGLRLDDEPRTIDGVTLFHFQLPGVTKPKVWWRAENVEPYPAECWAVIDGVLCRPTRHQPTGRTTSRDKEQEARNAFMRACRDCYVRPTLANLSRVKTLAMDISKLAKIAKISTGHGRALRRVSRFDFLLAAERFIQTGNPAWLDVALEAGARLVDEGHSIAHKREP